MIPELGKYAVEVLSSYAVSLAMIIALVWISVARARRVRSDLAAIEKRMRGNG